MKLSKLNNVVVKNSLYVILFVISYTALLRYYKTEFFVDSTIDSVFGAAGSHDNPGLKNQTEESCRQLALKDPKYVAWGYRTNDHPDPNWKKTCFLYTKGFKPFNGNPNDKAHKTGCLRPGEKVSLGCKIPPTQPTTVTTSQQVQTSVVKPSVVVRKSILDPEYDFNKVVAKRKNEYKGKELKDFVVELSNELAPEHKQLVCIAFYWFIMKKSQERDGSKDDDNWAKSLNKVGLPWEMYANLLPSMLGWTMGANGTLATLADALSDNMISVYIQNYVQRYKNFVPFDVKEYKYSLEGIDWNNFRQQTSDVVTLGSTTTQHSQYDIEAAMHFPLLALVWLKFLLALPQSPDEKTMDNVWKQSLADVGLPSGLYDVIGKVLYGLLNNTKKTFKTVDEKILAPFEDRVLKNYRSYVQVNDKFEPADKIKYEKAFALLEMLGSSIADVSVDPSMYTKEYVQQVKMIIDRNTNIPPPQVEDKPTPIQVKPIINSPIFKPYEESTKNTTTETTKENPAEPATPPSTSTDASPTTTKQSPMSFAASISSKFLLYILISFIVSVVFIVLVVWGAVSITKAKTAPNSTF